jgi:hypothetical protein
MLDAGYSILVKDLFFIGDIQKCSNSEIQKYPVLQRRINDIQRPASGISQSLPSFGS